jgi:hypothetical protein
LLEDFLHDFALEPEQPIDEQSVEEDVKTLALFDYLNTRGSSDEDDSSDDDSDDSDEFVSHMELDDEVLALLRERIEGLTGEDDEDDDDEDDDDEDDDDEEENEEEKEDKDEDKKTDDKEQAPEEEKDKEEEKGV